MITVPVPGRSQIELHHAVFDLNGTLTVDGALIGGTSERVQSLGEQVTVYVATSDTMGTAETLTPMLGCELVRVGPPGESQAKADLVRRLGAQTTVAIGNGANDVEMLEAAAIGICVVGDEGAASAALIAAQVVVTDPLAALELLLNPIRLAATLRR